MTVIIVLLYNNLVKTNHSIRISLGPCVHAADIDVRSSVFRENQMSNCVISAAPPNVYGQHSCGEKSFTDDRKLLQLNNLVVFIKLILYLLLLLLLLPTASAKLIDFLVASTVFFDFKP